MTQVNFTGSWNEFQSYVQPRDSTTEYNDSFSSENFRFPVRVTVDVYTFEVLDSRNFRYVRIGVMPVVQSKL